jgi:hypothetical protein
LISRLLEQNRLIEPWCRQAMKVCYAPDSLASLFDAIRKSIEPVQHLESVERLGDIAQGEPERLKQLTSLILGGVCRLCGGASPTGWLTCGYLKIEIDCC